MIRIKNEWHVKKRIVCEFIFYLLFSWNQRTLSHWIGVSVCVRVISNRFSSGFDFTPYQSIEFIFECFSSERSIGNKQKRRNSDKSCQCCWCQCLCDVPINVLKVALLNGGRGREKKTLFLSFLAYIFYTVGCMCCALICCNHSVYLSMIDSLASCLKFNMFIFFFICPVWSAIHFKWRMWIVVSLCFSSIFFFSFAHSPTIYLVLSLPVSPHVRIVLFCSSFVSFYFIIPAANSSPSLALISDVSNMGKNSIKNFASSTYSYVYVQY